VIIKKRKLVKVNKLVFLNLGELTFSRINIYDFSLFKWSMYDLVAGSIKFHEVEILQVLLLLYVMCLVMLLTI
jgi:hypothetical protein